MLVKGPSIMRHYATVKAILCLPILLAPYASADEAADRVAIDRAVAALNELPQRADVFTDDASSELKRLPNVKPRAFRVPGPQDDRVSLPRTDGPTVTISHEIWGEATINIPGVASLPVFEILNPRIVNGAIRFITPEVALTDGIWKYEDENGMTQTIPILFVMKKEGSNWKIASLRVLAPY
jgi:hypothetical protein